MPRICVVADDLTGAAEIGGIALSCGLSSTIMLSPEYAGHCTGDVIIFDTNSRGMLPEAAAAEISKLAMHVDFSRFDLVYKKMDSVLRGPVFSEITTLAGILHKNSILLIPANPSRKRTILNGIYYIDNQAVSETDFRSDPQYPRISSRVTEMISDYYCRDFNGKIIIPDISSEEDIRLHSALSDRKDVLYAGGADFFRSLLTTGSGLRLQESEMSLQFPESRYFIIGSVADTRKTTISRLKQKGFPVHRMPVQVLERKEELGKWINKITCDLVKHKKGVVTGPVKRIRDASLIPVIADSLVAVAKAIAGNTLFPGLFFLEGGETASLFFRTMEWKELVVLHAFADGIVVLGYGDGERRFVVKPGSYPWPDSFLNN